MQWPLYLSAMLIIMNAIIGAVSVTAGLLWLCLRCCIWNRSVDLHLQKETTAKRPGGIFFAEYSWMQKQLLTDLELPYGIADESGRVLWGILLWQKCWARKTI